MFKRTVAVGIVGIVLAATFGGDALAHYYFVGGVPIYHSLGSTELLISQVPNPAAHPAKVVRTMLIEEYEFVCLNPQGNQTSLSVSLRSATAVVSQDLTQGNWDKKKGTVTLAPVTFNTDFLARPEDCVNPNWIPLPETVLATKVTETVETLLCDDAGNCVDPETKTIYHCTLEGGYDALHLPPANTLYKCPADQTETFHFK
jgi:hypothetical protein